MKQERGFMLTQPTIEKLIAMRLRGMAEAFREQQESADSQQLSFEERLGLLIDRQWNWRQNRALERRLRNGRLQGATCVEDIDYRTARGLDRQVVRSLTQESAWVREHQNLFLIGPTGIGKTWLARAFAQKACRDGYTALFQKAAELFRSLATSRADGSHSKLLYQLGRVDLLIVDDWAMAPMTEAERRDFLEICDARYQARSTLLTSQLPVASWHAQIADPTIADSILDRLVHNAHRIELKGESMRKKRGPKGGKENA
jgi:DNA replication protein DnaC